MRSHKNINFSLLLHSLYQPSVEESIICSSILKFSLCKWNPALWDLLCWKHCISILFLNFRPGLPFWSPVARDLPWWMEERQMRQRQQWHCSFVILLSISWASIGLLEAFVVVLCTVPELKSPWSNGLIRYGSCVKSGFSPVIRASADHSSVLVTLCRLLCPAMFLWLGLPCDAFHCH